MGGGGGFVPVAAVASPLGCPFRLPRRTDGCPFRLTGSALAAAGVLRIVSCRGCIQVRCSCCSRRRARHDDDDDNTSQGAAMGTRQDDHSQARTRATSSQLSKNHSTKNT